jgi:hypothetical protein
MNHEKCVLKMSSGANNTDTPDFGNIKLPDISKIPISRIASQKNEPDFIQR